VQFRNSPSPPTELGERAGVRWRVELNLNFTPALILTFSPGRRNSHRLFFDLRMTVRPIPSRINGVPSIDPVRVLALSLSLRFLAAPAAPMLQPFCRPAAANQTPAVKTTGKRNLEARVGIERVSFTVPSLTHSVSRVSITLFFRGSSCFFDRPLNARSLPRQRPFIARQV